MTTFYKFKMAWGGGGSTRYQCWKYNRQLLTQCLSGYGKGGKCVLDNLNGFGLNTTYFDTSFYINGFFFFFFFASRHRCMHTHFKRKTLFPKGRLDVLKTSFGEKNKIKDEKNNLVKSDGKMTESNQVSCDVYTCIIISLIKKKQL